ncbi:MAG: GIY-YIG nuclease family protein [Candidatus Gottesmanbacteria bacterium]
MWHVYIVKCTDSSLYTGITLDVERRVREHNCSTKGAVSLRYKRPVYLVYSKEYDTHLEAARREYEIKHWKREDKLKLIEQSSAE